MKNQSDTFGCLVLAYAFILRAFILAYYLNYYDCVDMS